MTSALTPPRAPISHTATFETIDSTIASVLDAHGELILFVEEDVRSRLLTYSAYARSYVFAERDAHTNLSWCPDCRAGDELLRLAFDRAAREGLTVPAFVDASVGPREGYKVCAHAGTLCAGALRICSRSPRRTPRSIPTACTHKSNSSAFPRSFVGQRCACACPALCSS